MYPSPFEYHRAGTLEEASRLLGELGEEARVLAGGQSLIPLMKLRLAAPGHLVDLNFVPDLGTISEDNGTVRMGAMVRHAEIEGSRAAQRIPILYDCAAGIADQQVRNRGTIGGSLAEADPSGDWGAVLLTLETKVRAAAQFGERTMPLEELFVDAYTTSLGQAELVREVIVEVPPKGSGGAYVAYKRCAPVYATASAAVQLTMADRETCREARIALGCVGLMTIRAREAEKALMGKRLDAKAIARAAEAARAAAEPQTDIRGSVEYKRDLVGALVKKAIERAVARSRGEKVEGGHIYA